MAHYDLFVIGGGSGGVAAARSSSALGAKVGIAEFDKFGGTCVNRGCMPKKWYMYASQFQQEFIAAKSLGWEFDTPTFNWDTLKNNTFKEINRLNGVYNSMLNKAGVVIHQGKAFFKAPNTVIVNNEEITAEKIMIAVGGKPFIPEIEGKEFAITSDEAFHLPSLPKSILIVGAGYIGVEFACIFNALGVDTTLMYRADKILRGFDEDVRNHVQQQMNNNGITTVSSTKPISIVKNSDEQLSILCSQDKHHRFEQIMFATGRQPNLQNIGIEQIGLATDSQGKIIVDEWQQTNIAHIYAVGDVTNTNYDLTPVAINEGRAFADSQFGTVRRNFSDFVVPTAVFSQPQIGSVGLTETQAREQFANIDIYRSEFRSTKFRLLDDNQQMLMLKLIVDADTDIVLGAHMAGSDAAEIIQTLAVAIRAGATKTDFDRTVGVHPTVAEEFVTMREKLIT